MTALHQTPFAVLNVSIREDRRRIVEMAEERSLEFDHDACQKARSELTNPRTRLSAEMAWLPGISPRKASLLINALLSNPMSIREESGLPVLAHLNLMASAFESVNSNDTVDNIANLILEMAYLVEKLSVNEVLCDINEDRIVSGFPEVKSLDQIEEELIERKRYYRNAIKNAMEQLTPTSLVEVMTQVVDCSTSGGERHAPSLIDDLVDSYEVETQGFLQKEADNIDKLIKATRDSAKSGESAVKPFIDKLMMVSRNWDSVAQPIQLCAKARGIEHDASHEIAQSIRSLAVDLFNEYDMVVQTQRLTTLIKELFAELPEVSEIIERDTQALSDIMHGRKKSDEDRRKWERDVTYTAEVGLIFKDKLSISPAGISWKNKLLSLDAVTRVRWGGVRQSVNGIPTGTKYTVAFGDTQTESVIELNREATYSAFTDKLWQAVCIRLLTELLAKLQAGNELNFGGMKLRDDGVTLIKHKLFGSEPVIRSWGQVNIWSAGGYFSIGDMTDKKIYNNLSYIEIANVHVLEQAIRMAFKKPGMQRLSDLLN